MPVVLANLVETHDRGTFFEYFLAISRLAAGHFCVSMQPTQVTDEHPDNLPIQHSMARSTTDCRYVSKKQPISRFIHHSLLSELAAQLAKGCQ
jgi:hypothetical protein